MTDTNQDRLEEIKKIWEDVDPLARYITGESIGWLIQEVERLREDRETLSKQARGMIIVDESKKIESLTKELEELREELDSVVKGAGLVNKKLEAENAELKKKLEGPIHKGSCIPGKGRWVCKFLPFKKKGLFK